MTRPLTLVLTFAVSLAGLSYAQAAPPSGMLLGIYAFPTWSGLRVTGTLPGYSAHGRLVNGDVLRQVTADGWNIYPTRNSWQLEHAKSQIGPFRPAALEVWRPGVGLTYFWVEFLPVGGGPVLRGAPQQMKARIMTEQEKPGAAALFRKGGGGQVSPNPPGPGSIGPGAAKHDPQFPGFPGGGNVNGRPKSPFANHPGSLFNR